MSSIRQFKCYMPGCGAITPFDLSHIRIQGMNFVTCSGCSKKFVGTYKQTCCSVQVKFASVEEGTKTPVFNVQSFRK